MQITKQQLQTILDNAPPGVDKIGVIEGLYNRGVSVEGVDSYDAGQFIQTYKQSRTNTTLQQTVNSQEQDTNLGTGFTPTFESEEDDSIVVDFAKAIGNAPKSGYMLGKDVLTAVAHPVQTAKAITTLIKGASGNVAQNVLENTNFGQSIISKMNDYRIQTGKPELERDADGKFILPDTESSAVADKVGEYFRDRYGSWSNLRESLVEDPVGVLGDVATVGTGIGAGVRTVGTATRTSRLASAGQTIMRASDMLEPTTAITRGVGATGRAIGDTALGRAVGEAAPTAGRFAEGQVVRALDLTQGDVARIAEKTGNDVTDFITRNELFKETPEQIASALDTFREKQYKLVRDEVGKIDEIYFFEEVPQVRDSLNAIYNVVKDVPGLEESAAEVQKLLSQEAYSLSDIQRVKEILDENISIYNRLGDAKQTATARGLDNVRQQLRSFIEEEVSKATNGNTNIGQLNNDVSTAYELSSAIETRATRGLTRQQMSVFDGILGFSAAAAFDPLTAIGVVGLKKLAETPSFRISLAKILTATPIEDAIRWASEISTNKVSPATRQALSQIIEEARKQAELIESGSQVITETGEIMNANQSTQQ